MRRLSLPRRRKRTRLANTIEQVALRILTAVWIGRTLLRHGRPSIR